MRKINEILIHNKIILESQLRLKNAFFQFRPHWRYFTRIFAKIVQTFPFLWENENFFKPANFLCRFTKKKFEREAREKKNDLFNSNMALLAGLRYLVLRTTTSSSWRCWVASSSWYLSPLSSRHLPAFCRNGPLKILSSKMEPSEIR